MNKNVPSLRFKGFADDWELYELKEILNYERPDSFIVSNEDYEDTNSVPVLTANKGFILGYTNENRTYENPCIIFDDSTLDSKYVDFPFMVKSSAIKILTVKKNFELKFTYELLKMTNIENIGHARHYISLVQPSLVRTPNHIEQKSISQFTMQLDKFITLHQQKHEKLINVKKSLLDKMFPKNGEAIPSLRFKGFTDLWEEYDLGELAPITMGQSPNGINYTANPDDHILVQGSADMENGRVRPRVWTTQITKFARKNDLIFSVRAPVGSVGKTDYEVVIGRGVAAIKGNEFIYQQLLRFDMNGYWKTISTGSTFDSINSLELNKTKVNSPKTNEIEKIGSFMKSIDLLITLHQQKYEKLINVKKALLQKMFV
jgi:type I restriction enzyme, S subunit